MGAKAKQRAEAQGVSAIFVWVPEWASNTKERASTERCNPKNREKHGESVREWKRKRRHFYLLKLHTKKINWWSSHGVFWCYNHGELEYSGEDFTTGYVVRLYLLLEIYLLYIQFIVNTSCNIYFIVDFFRTCPVVFPSTLEGFPRKIWCSYVIVFMWCLLNFLFP